MKRFLALYLLCFIFGSVLFANDGSYYVRGNQLIPIIETDISVKKEILKITRKNKEQVEVSVYYEFFNPGKALSFIVRFEAFSPRGDVDPEPKNGQHLNTYDFPVNMKNRPSAYKVAIVNDSTYYDNGIFTSLTRAQIEDSNAD